jgi:hypothetical protein
MDGFTGALMNTRKIGVNHGKVAAKKQVNSLGVFNLKEGSQWIVRYA